MHPESTTPLSQPDPGALEIDPKEKAKMDYQLHLENKKIAICGTRWREILWDKFVFALCVILLSGLALFPINCFMDHHRISEAKELEKFKLDEARQRFFLEKQLDAMLAVSSVMSKLSAVYFRYASGDKSPGQNEFSEALDKAREEVNRTQFLFDLEFKKNTDRYFEIYRQMSQLSVKDWTKYRPMMAQHNRDFDAMCHNRLTRDKQLNMRLADISYEQRITLSPQEYIERHYEFWMQRKK